MSKMSVLYYLPLSPSKFFQLTKIETPVNLCQATGDPHYTTFDGKYAILNHLTISLAIAYIFGASQLACVLSAEINDFNFIKIICGNYLRHNIAFITLFIYLCIQLKLFLVLRYLIYLFILFFALLKFVGWCNKKEKTKNKKTREGKRGPRSMTRLRNARAFFVRMNTPKSNLSCRAVGVGETMKEKRRTLRDGI